MTSLATIPGQVPPPGSWTIGCRFAQRCLFARDECLTAIPLLDRTQGEGLVRCIRHEEVRGREDEWREAGNAWRRNDE